MAFRGNEAVVAVLASRVRGGGVVIEMGTILVAASLTAPGAGAGSSWRSVASSTRSSEPSTGAAATYSTRTQAVPLTVKPNRWAARLETSMMRLPA